MVLALLFGWLFGFVGSMPLAGPIALLVFGRGVRGATKSGLAIAAGSSVAESGYAFLAYWGMAELVARFPNAVMLSRGAAALILLGLGLFFVLRKDGAPKATEEAAEHVKKGAALGFLITALNPTFLATWTAAVTVLHSLDLVAPTLAAAVPFAIGVGAGIFSWFAVMLALMARWRDRFQPATLDRVLQAMGVALAGMGLWSGASILGEALRVIRAS